MSGASVMNCVSGGVTVHLEVGPEPQGAEKSDCELLGSRGKEMREVSPKQ